MKFLKTIIPAALVASALLFSVSANAVVTGVCQLSDVQFPAGNNADQCSGQTDGNDTAALVGTAFTGTWSQLAKYDAPGANPGGPTNGSYLGIAWSIAWNAATPGQFTLSWVDTAPTGDLPLIMDIVFAIKGSDAYSLYLFNNELFGLDPLSRSGTFVVNIINNGNQQAGFSHITAYGRQNGDEYDCPRTDPNWPTCQPSTVPEPGSLALLGLGLLGLGVSRRRLSK